MNAPAALLGKGTPSLFITVTHQNSASPRGINHLTSPNFTQTLLPCFTLTFTHHNKIILEYFVVFIVLSYVSGSKCSNR